MRVLDNLCTGHRANLKHLEKNVEFIEGDVTDASSVAAAVKGVDCVFHEAALASVPRSVERPLDTHAACVTGTLNMLDQGQGRRATPRVCRVEQRLWRPANVVETRDGSPASISPYGAAKLAGELYCHAFAATYRVRDGVHSLLQRVLTAQDPHSQYSAVIPLFITAMLAGRQPTVYGDGPVAGFYLHRQRGTGKSVGSGCRRQDGVGAR